MTRLRPQIAAGRPAGLESNAGIVYDGAKAEDAEIHMVLATTTAGFIGVESLHRRLTISSAGEISAVEALRQACQSLKQLCGHMKATFNEAYTQYEQRPESGDQPMAPG